MLAWWLCDFSGDPDQYCKETYIFVFFQGVLTPSPLGRRMTKTNSDDLNGLVLLSIWNRDSILEVQRFDYFICCLGSNMGVSSGKIRARFCKL